MNFAWVFQIPSGEPFTLASFMFSFPPRSANTSSICSNAWLSNPFSTANLDVWFRSLQHKNQLTETVDYDHDTLATQPRHEFHFASVRMITACLLCSIHGPDDLLYWPQALGVKGHTSHLIENDSFLLYISSCPIYVRFLFTPCWLLSYSPCLQYWVDIGRRACFFSLLIFLRTFLSPCLLAPANSLLCKY